MKQTVFETKLRAEELLQEALNVWRQSPNSDRFEGLEDDPVMLLMITALAYQANETASDQESIKEEVLQDFAQLLKPYEVGHATPATAVVELALNNNVPELDLTSQSVFTLSESNHTFIPLLNTRVLNAKIRSIARIDGRRWKVSLTFKNPISELSGFTFTIKNTYFQDIRVSINGQTQPIIKPWDYSELPLSESFGLDTILYNRSQTYNASATCFDLFAKQNVRMFMFAKGAGKKTIPIDTNNIDLVFEFSGINDRFVFDKSNISLNTVILVNAKENKVTLSNENPIVRIAGSTANADNTSSQFLHAVRPSEEQMYNDAVIDVRRVAADRFNQGRLLNLLNTLLAKYHSDFYAFQDLPGISNEKTMIALQNILSQLLGAAKQDKLHNVSGVYMMLRQIPAIQQRAVSLEVTYLTTSGTLVNAFLTPSSSFTVPPGVNAAETRQIANPVYGMDEISGDTAKESLTRYYVATNDRIVTSADIKLFCYNELLTHYGIVRDMVMEIRVSHRQQPDLRKCGYEILVEITLADNTFVKRSFAEKIPQVEILLQKMIEVRSANIYPIFVSIKIEN